MPRIDRQGVTDLFQISPALRPPSESIFETAADQSSLSFASCFALIVNIGYMDEKGKQLQITPSDIYTATQQYQTKIMKLLHYDLGI